MKIGITGTREGMNEHQAQRVRRILTMVIEKGPAEFHHGDCAGVDVEAAAIARELGFRIVCHPPKSDNLRGFFPSDESRRPLGYLARDRNIVDETQCLIVVPLQDKWQPKGGTWYTNDYAEKQLKPRVIVYPRNGVTK
jgi:hypothetical protein